MTNSFQFSRIIEKEMVWLLQSILRQIILNILDPPAAAAQ